MRDTVVAALRADSALVSLLPDAQHIESSRLIPLDDAALPCVLVYLRGEKVGKQITVAPREYRLTSELVVKFVTRTAVTWGPAEDELDAVAERLEVVMAAIEASDLGGLVLDMQYTGTDVETELEGAKTTLTMALRYRVELGFVVAPLVVDDFIRAVLELAYGDAQADDPTNEVTLPTT